MKNLIIKECTGFTKEEAFKNLPFNPALDAIPGCNITQAWTKQGKPIPGTKEFTRFVLEQLEEKTKNIPGLGVYLTLDPSKDNTRKKPYSIINNKTIGCRQWVYVYYIQEVTDYTIDSVNDLDIDENGDEIEGENKLNIVVKEYSDSFVGKYYSKAEAVAAVKELTTVTHKTYALRVLKEPDINPVAAYCVYRPSKGAKTGTWIAAGFEDTDIDSDKVYQ